MSLLGVILGLALLMWLTMRNWNLLLAAPLCALLVAISSGISVLPDVTNTGALSFITSYMTGFSGFVANWFFMFLLGALFGKLMENCGAADAIAQILIRLIGAERALLAIIVACAVLTYGGVSLFVVAFSVYPMALSLFKQADLPRRFLPAAIGFGSVTITMTSAGSLEIQNWIPIQYLGTSPYAGWQVSLVVALFMGVSGYWWLNWMIQRAKKSGENFEVWQDDPEPVSLHNLPSAWRSLSPIILVLIASFFLHHQLKQAALIVSLSLGIAATYLFNYSYFKNTGAALSSGAMGALMAIANTAAVVGFGAVAKEADGFKELVTYMTAIPGTPLLSAAIAVTVIAGLTGSASGGQVIALPLLAPQYLAQGVDPSALHRVVALASGGLDAMPHNGYVVTTIRGICRETHQRAYLPLAAMMVVVTTVGMLLAVLLFML